MRDKVKERTVFAVHYTRELHGVTTSATANVRAANPATASAHVRQITTGKVYINKVKVARGDVSGVIDA